MCEWLTNLFKKKPPVPVEGNLNPLEWDTLYGTAAFWNGVMRSSPSMVATNPDETSAVMLLHNSAALSDFHVRVVGKTVRQTRLNTPPKAWECFWLCFNYTPGPNLTKTMNYVALKPTGVEIGNAYDSLGQTFLGEVLTADGQTPIGQEFTLDVTKLGQLLQVRLNNALVYSHMFTGELASNGKPKWLFNEAGTFGLYAEDAEIEIKEFTIL